jgi:hypothetical protein
MIKRLTFLLICFLAVINILKAQPTTEIQKIYASDGAINDGFGSHISISGNYAIVSANGDDDWGSGSGSAYILYNNGGIWEETAKLTPSDATIYQSFGTSVSISGDYAIVGAYGDNDWAGAAYIFYNNEGTWEQYAKLTAPDAATVDWFGWSVSISGNYAIIGAHGDDVGFNGSGSAYIFYNNNGTWILKDKITASDPAENDLFGYSVSISSDYAIVSSYYDDDGGDMSGSAYIFHNNGSIWEEEEKITASDAAAGDRFGWKVNISGNYAIVGAPWDDDSGEDSGSSYIFFYNGVTWQEISKLTALDAAAGDWFGRSVFMSGDYAIVGAVYDDDGGDNSGSAYLYYNNEGVWEQISKLTASDAAAGDRFGSSVFISGDFAYVGAELGDGIVDNSGSAYIFGSPIPIIIAQPVSKIACENDSISFIIETNSGNTYQWQKNNIDINGATDTIFTIVNVQLSDEAEYRCIVSNEVDSVFSDIATLTVNPGYNLTENVIICSGDNYTFPDGTTSYNITTQIIHSSQLQTVFGCDSIITTTVDIDTTYDMNETTTLCSGGSYTFPDGTTQHYITSQIFHTSFLQTINGCDSIIQTTINIYELDLNVTATETLCGEATGTAICIVNGDNAPFSYLWSNGSTDFFANDLNAGTHFIQVTDNLGCFGDEYFTIANTDGPEISLQSLTDVQCFGGNNGSIDINVTGGTQPYSYEWSTGNNTQDLINLQAGWYNVTVTDFSSCVSTMEFEIDQPDAIQVDFDLIQATCSDSDGQITAYPSGGTPSYLFYWSSGETTSQITGLAAGTYTLKVTDDASCEYSTVVDLTNLNAPVISVDSIINTSCGNEAGAVYVSISGGTLPYGLIEWSNGSNEEDLIGVGLGIYTLNVTDDAGCMAVLTEEVNSETSALQPICMVLIDSTSESNLIVWEKVGSTSIDHYNIYRESSYAGQFNLIGSISYNDLSEFLDTEANPATRSWRYKISAVDFCDNESELSDPHKTIHLTINEGINQTINLIWDHYVGFEYGTYRIYRYLNSSGWIVLDDLPSNLTSYTDEPPSMGGLYYKIAVQKEIPCTSSKSDTYDESVSNLKGYASNIWIGPSIGADNIILYPNPSEGTIRLEGNYMYKIEIINGQGQIVDKRNVNSISSTLNFINLNKGIYIIKVYCLGYTCNKKLILR